MAFNPYHKWLGISPRDCPPDHYRLLSVDKFESDLDVIEGAADKQMAFVRQYQSGEHAAEAAKILNELAAARLCLLKPATKRDYDNRLRQGPPGRVQDLSDSSSPKAISTFKRKKKAAKKRVNFTLLSVGGIGVVLLIAGVLLFSEWNKPKIETQVERPKVAESNRSTTNESITQSSTSIAPATSTSHPAVSIPAPEISAPQKTPLATGPEQKASDQNLARDTAEMNPQLAAQKDAEIAPSPSTEEMSGSPTIPVTDTGTIGEAPSEKLPQTKTEKSLATAISTYEKEKEIYRKSVLDFLQSREAGARKAGDKKIVDQVAAEREDFETWNVVPRNATPAIIKRRSDARIALENTFNSAIKSYVKAHDDLAASNTESELRQIQGDDWQHLDLTGVRFKGDTFQINKGSTISTKVEFTGPIEIHAIARTEKNNIRFYANSGSCVIFNWEVNRKELRVCRPDGHDTPESGSIAVAKLTPLTPNVWYWLRWRITSEGMHIFVNDQLIFSELKPYDLSHKTKIKIATVDSNVEVRDFHVVSLTNP